MKRKWLLLALAVPLACSAPAELFDAQNRSDATHSSIDKSTWNSSSIFTFPSSSQLVEEREIRSRLSSESRSFLTRPQIKHPETTAEIQGAGNHQAFVLAGSTSAEQCTPYTAFAELVTCTPFVDAGTTAHNCLTAFSVTSGCDIDPSPSTTTISGTPLVVGCKQDDCNSGGCAAPTETSVKASGVACKDCSTSDGLVYAPQSTIPLSGSDPLSASRADPTATTAAAREGLRKRTLMEPRDYTDYDHFMLSELAKARREGRVVPHRPGRTGGRSSAMIWEFIDEPENFAVERLCGCTVILLISTRGIWISHHWESPTFMNSANPKETFLEQDILVGMFKGDDSGWYPGLNDFTGAGEIFDEQVYGRTRNYVKAFIYTPWIDPNYYGRQYPPWKFYGEVQKIQNLLSEMYNVYVPVITYKPILGDAATKERLWQTTSRGKILVQFDPVNWLMAKKLKDGEKDICYQQEAILRVWDDSGNMVLDDFWIALPDQTVMVDMQQKDKRSEADQIDWAQPYCGMPNHTESSCRLTSAIAMTIPPTTVGSQTVAVQSVRTSTFCTGGESIASVETQTDKDGKRTLHCNGGKDGSTTPMTTLPPYCQITSAPETVLPAKTLGTQTIPAAKISANTYCTCGSSIAGVETKTDSDGTRWLYCNVGSDGPRQPIKTIPPQEDCYVTSAPETTLPDRTVGVDKSVVPGATIPANTYCQCGGTIAGVQTSTGGNGEKTYHCAQSGAAGSTTISFSPTPTACSLTTVPQTTWDSTIFSAATYCQCGDKVVGLDTTTGNDGGTTVYCAGAAATLVPITTATPSCAVSASVPSGASTTSYKCDCNSLPGRVNFAEGSDGKTTFDCLVGSQTWEGVSIAEPSCKVEAFTAPTATSYSCTCNDHTTGSVNFAMRSDGKTTFDCLVGSLTWEGVSTEGPQPTTCEAKKDSCVCGQETGSIRSTTRDDGKTGLNCLVGTRKTLPAFSVGAPSQTDFPGTCRLHVHEFTWYSETSDWPIQEDSSAELYVNGVFRWRQKLRGTFFDVNVLSAKDTKLLKDIYLYFAVPSGKRLFRRQWGSNYGSLEGFRKYMLGIAYGAREDFSHAVYAKNNDSGQLAPPDTSTLPYCQIGNWDLEVNDTTSDWPNRQLDCYFNC